MCIFPKTHSLFLLSHIGFCCRCSHQKIGLPETRSTLLASGNKIPCWKMRTYISRLYGTSIVFASIPMKKWLLVRASMSLLQFQAQYLTAAYIGLEQTTSLFTIKSKSFVAYCLIKARLSGCLARYNWDMHKGKWSPRSKLWLRKFI